MYEDLIIEFTPAISTLPSCGDITYEVIDLATGNPLVIFKAEIDAEVLPATLTLLSTNKADTEAPTEIVIRASQGNVASEDSEDITL